MSLGLCLNTGCALLGVEPDEIDVLDGETGSLTGSGDNGDTTGLEATGDEDPGSSEGPGDGDGDPATGDGDGDPTGGDGDGDSDPTGDGDGDGDATGGEEVPCEELDASPLELGPNPISIAAGDSAFAAMCGAEGPEELFTYTDEIGGDFSFTLTEANFHAALYSADSCAPLVESDCVLSPDALIVNLGPGDTVYLFVDATTADGGDGQLVVDVL